MNIEMMTAAVGNPNRLDTQENYEQLRCLTQSEWKDVAWKGDVLNSKVVICTGDSQVHNVQVTPSDFVGETGVIPSTYVQTTWLKEIKANVGWSQPQAPVKVFPDVIHKGGAIDMSAEKVMFSWITIKIPEETKAGIYTGKVMVTAEELDEPYNFTYTIEVLDLVQPNTNDSKTQIQIWQHPFSVANYYGLSKEEYFTDKHFKYMRESMKEYQRLGGRDVVANIVEEAWNHQSYYGDPSMVKWTRKADGSYVFDYTWYDAWIRFQIECNVLDVKQSKGQIKCYSIVPWNNQIAWYDEAEGSMLTQVYTPGEEDWKQVWTIFLQDFMKHSKEMGWFDITYIAMDERKKFELAPAVDLIEAIKDEHGKSFKISSAFNYSDESDHTFTDRIHDISINTAHIDIASEKLRDMANHRRELGLYTTIYTCTENYPGSFTISDPGDNYWVMWYSMTHNTDGFLKWAWDNWVEDPLTDVSYKSWEPGDGWFVYPAEKDADESSAYYYSTPRHELLKQGIRDINKAKYLMNTSEEDFDRIQALVRSLKEPAKGKYYGSAVPANEGERELVFAECKRMKETLIMLAKQRVKGM